MKNNLFKQWGDGANSVWGKQSPVTLSPIRQGDTYKLFDSIESGIKNYLTNIATLGRELLFIGF